MVFALKGISILAKNEGEIAKKIVEHSINNKYFEKIISNVIRIINELKIALIKMKNKLSELENIYDDNIYNNRIGRYKSVENVFSFENELIKTYFEYSNVFNKIQKSLNIQDIKNKILL